MCLGGLYHKLRHVSVFHRSVGLFLGRDNYLPLGTVESLISRENDMVLIKHINNLAACIDLQNRVR